MVLSIIHRGVSSNSVKLVKVFQSAECKVLHIFCDLLYYKMG